jgi:hypothetical protein
MARIGDGNHHLWHREVAGQKAAVLVKTHHVDPSRVISAYVVLSDCLIELRAYLGMADFDRVLQSIQPLK